MNGKKLKKSSSLVMFLLITFVANKWFEQGWSQPDEIVKWVLVFFSCLILIVIIYINLDKNGNF